MKVRQEPEERQWGIDWCQADQVAVGSVGWRDGPGGRLKYGVTISLCNGPREKGHRITVSRVRARQIAIALAQASGMQWERHGPLRPIPLRLSRMLKRNAADGSAS